MMVSLALTLACSTAAPRIDESAPRIELLEAGADIWAFRARFEGVVVGTAELHTCAFERDGSLYPAAIERDRFSVEVNLQPGTNELHARCKLRDGRTLHSPRVRHEVRMQAGPIARARATLHAGRTLLDARDSSESEHRPAGIVRYAWSRGAGSERVELGEGATLELAGEQTGRFQLQVTDALGREDVAVASIAPAQQPNWAESAVGYGVLPPLFGAGGLADVASALDRLAELGVNALWLAPIFAAPDDDFGYAVVDYFRVRSDYGDAASLRELVQRAHDRGLRVLLDLPANHSSNQHPYYLEASRLGPRSHYYDFYDRDAKGRATHYFDWTHLPNLNFDHPEVGRFMREASRYWVSSFDVDGYRVDAAWGVRQRNPEYWPLLRAELARVEPDVVLLAEASARDAYYLQHGFDLAYDWTDELGHHAWEHVFTHKQGIAKRLNDAVQKTGGDRSKILRFLNNNDTGKRFITRHGEALTRVATAALLTLPGVPCLYSFDEVGAEFEPYRELAPVRKDHPELRAFHQRWIHLRRTREAVWGDGFEVLHAGARDEAYVFVRRRGAQALLIALNFSAEPVQLQLAVADAAWPAERARELSSGELLTRRSGVLALRLPAHATLAFEPYDAPAAASVKGPKTAPGADR